jgi:trigger factor
MVQLMKRIALLVASAGSFSPAPARVLRPLRATALDVEESAADSTVSFAIDVPGSLTKAAFKNAATEIAKTTTIPGWRAKDWKRVPTSLIADTVGTVKLKSLAIERLTETEVHGAISGLDVAVVGQAQLVGTPEELCASFKPGEDWRMRVKIGVWPEARFDSPWDDGSLAVTVEREAKDMSVRDKALEALRERYCDVVDAPADRVAAEGDVAVVDVDGYLRDPESGARAGPLPIATPVGGDDLDLVLEPGKFLPGVVEALIGQKAGTTVKVPVDFPENKQYREEQPLAGLKAGFDVTIKKLRVRTIPELDDAFASKIRDGLTLKELEDEVEATVGAQEDDKTTDKLHAALEAALADRVSTPVPEAIVVESAKQKFTVMLSDMRAQGTPDAQLMPMASAENFKKYLEVARPAVTKNLRARLAVEAVGASAGLEPDATDVADQMELVKRQYEQQQEKQPNANTVFNEAKAREKIEAELLRIAVMDHVAAKAKITYVDAAPEPDNAEAAAAA